MAHAKLSPSGAYRWSDCTAAPGAEAGRPDSSNAASRWGTAAHLISSTCLETGAKPAAFLGKFVWFPANRGVEQIVDAIPLSTLFGNGEFAELISQEMVDCCDTYVGYVQTVVALTGGRLLVEQRVSIEHITGEAGATGTADAIIETADEVIVIDLKGGMGKVDAWKQCGVDVFSGAPQFEPNRQLAMYAHGSLRKMGWV